MQNLSVELYEKRVEVGMRKRVTLKINSGGRTGYAQLDRRWDGIELEVQNS